MILIIPVTNYHQRQLPVEYTCNPAIYQRKEQERPECFHQGRYLFHRETEIAGLTTQRCRSDDFRCKG